MTDAKQERPPFFYPGQKVTGALGAVAGLCVFGTVLVLMFYTRRPPPELPKGPDGRPAKEVLLELRALHQKELATYGWVDKEHGVVRVPVEHAMELLLEEARKAKAGPKE